MTDSISPAPAPDTAAPRAGGWDPLVRITHWGIATAILMNALVTEEGGSWHVWVGTAMAGLLALRLLWGFVGPERARFSAFPPSPMRAIRHIREILGGRVEPHPSHNGLGALMVYAIWATLAVVAATGFTMSGFPPAARAESHETQGPEAVTLQAAPGAAEAVQPRYGKEREEGEEAEEAEDARGAPTVGEGGDPARAEEADEGTTGTEAAEGSEPDEWAEELHEGAVNLLYILIGLHILGVLLETMRAGPHILGRMLGGGSD